MEPALNIYYTTIKSSCKEQIKLMSILNNANVIAAVYVALYS